MAAMTIGTTFCVYMISQIIRQEFIVDICPDKPTCICYGLPFRSCLEQYKTDIEVSQNCMLLSEAKANLIVDRCKYSFIILYFQEACIITVQTC